MVNFPKNGTVLLRTDNTLYTLVIVEGLMALHGHEAYCDRFEEISALKAHPGLSMQFRMETGPRKGHYVTTSPLREVQILRSFDGPTCIVCNMTFMKEDATQVLMAEEHVDVCPSCIKSLMNPLPFVQHEDHGDSL